MSSHKSDWTIDEVIKDSIIGSIRDIARNRELFHMPYAGGTERAIERYGLKEIFDH